MSSLVFNPVPSSCRYIGVDFDVPMKLKSTQDWGNTKSRVWDVVAELVALTVKPRPRNSPASGLQEPQSKHSGALECSGPKRPISTG